MTGGPIGLLKEGDIISLDVNARTLTVEITDAEMEARRKAWQAPKPNYTKGVMAKYARVVADASNGAVTI